MTEVAKNFPAGPDEGGWHRPARENIVADYSENDLGYLFQKVEGGYRYISIEGGEDDELGPVVSTLQAALQSAEDDWGTFSTSLLEDWAWGARLKNDARPLTDDAAAVQRIILAAHGEELTDRQAASLAETITSYFTS